MAKGKGKGKPGRPRKEAKSPYSAPGGKNPMAGAVAAASKGKTKVPYGK